MKIAEAYRHWAATYDSDRNLTRDLDESVTRRLLDGRRFRSVVELGCGTGKNTAFFADIADHVQAIDFSGEMMDQARRKAEGRNVTFTIADITHPWPFAAAIADLISCNLVLEHIPELPGVFAEAARVLRDGGRLFLSELHPFRQYQGTQATFVHNQETVRIPAFVHHVSEFLEAGARSHLALLQLNEWWHEQDEGKPPRLITMLFQKRAA